MTETTTNTHYTHEYYEKSKGMDFTKTPAYSCIRRVFDNQQIDTFADIGCGLGNQLKPFKSRFPYLIGMDISIVALKSAKLSLPQADFVLADARFQPFRDHSFDAGICISLIEHMDATDGRKVLEEIYRTSKSNSTFAIITPEHDSSVYRFRVSYDPSHVHLYRENELRNSLISVGFSIKQLLRSALTPKFRGISWLLKCDIVCVVQREVE